MKPFPEAFATPLRVEAKSSTGRAEEEHGIAADGNVRGGHTLGEVGGERGRMAAGKAPKPAAPLPDGGAREHGAATETPKISQGRAVGTAFEEDAIEDPAAELNGVVGAGLLEGGEGGERPALGALAEVPLDADVRDDGVAKNEVAEVVPVLDEAAVAAADPATLGARQREPSFSRQAPGELAIVLERPGVRAYLPHCQSVQRPGDTVAKQSRSGAFYLETEGRYVTGAKAGVSTNPAGADCLSQSGTFAQN